MVLEIIKRDGTRQSFDPNKIQVALQKAAGKDMDQQQILQCTTLVTNQLGDSTSVEEVQDIIERTLMQQQHFDVAKRFILYRDSRTTIRGVFDAVDLVDDYVHREDWEVKENANMAYSLQGLNNFISTKIISAYWNHKIYPQQIRDEHDSAALHIHDMGTLGAYCVGWDLKDLLLKGFTGVAGKVSSKPAKHFRTALGQMVNFFYTLQGETAGAQAFSNVDTLLAPFIRYDGLTKKQVKQALQEFVFNLAVPTRVGFQTPFTNITLDMSVPTNMRDEAIVIGGEYKDTTYGEYEKEVRLFNELFAQVMIEGDANSRVFTFPIPTYNITKEFNWDDSIYDGVWEMAAKYGIPYFSNFVNSDMDPEDARSMCCRLRLDQKELRKRGGGLFGSNPLTGSIGVVTINLPQIAYTQNNKTTFFTRLDELLISAKDSLEIKRKTIEQFTRNGLYPYSKFYLGSVHERFGEYWKNHFSTIGILGMNEAVRNLFGEEDITTPNGRAFANKVLDHIKTRMEEFQETTGNLFNLEATPGESTTYRFARHDVATYPNIIVANTKAFKQGAAPYYTNSSHLPVGYTTDIFEALTLQDNLQSKYTGGTVLHGFLGERIKPSDAKRLVNTITKNFKLPYFTLTPTFSICPRHGYLSGEHEYCPKCDEELTANGGVKI